MKLVPHRGPTNIRCHHTKFSCHGDCFALMRSPTTKESMRSKKKSTNSSTFASNVMQLSLGKILYHFFFKTDMLYWSIRYPLKNQVKTISGLYITRKFITAYPVNGLCYDAPSQLNFSKTHQSYVPFIQVILPIFVCSSHHPQARYVYLCSAGVSQDVQVWPRMTATPRAVHVGMQTRLMRGWLGTETLAPNVLKNTDRQRSAGKTVRDA